MERYIGVTVAPTDRVRHPGTALDTRGEFFLVKVYSELGVVTEFVPPHIGNLYISIISVTFWSRCLEGLTFGSVKCS